MAWGVLEAADPAMPTCHSPVTRPVWLPPSRRSVLPEERLDHPAPPAPCPSHCQRTEDYRPGDLAPAPVTIWVRHWTSS